MEEKLNERQRYYNDLKANYDELEYGNRNPNKNILNNLDNENSRHMTEKNSFLI